ncbi:hypothetical protein A2906_00675 [Candidatus Nomurabacteria bacterium RIFCSPLOWO2_01_FULL_37_25]|nr:MAG: hypothetical protein A2640_01145 [Candidatus Nomurabacteria bacterium RIFCSPHIGHO2_01_FULL_36_23]OGI88642.1 MAG: hypothetical protein A2906_00675 [Candidatus Nomurabacteria bacterium RIFCSPLOWO2_01_FULL_37_25]
MKVSFNWLKWYIPDVPEANKLADIFTHHVVEVESVEKSADDDNIFDINVLPNRAHDLLSHLGIAKEISSLLDIKFIDPTPKYKIPESQPTKLKIEIESDKCRRYMGRIVRNIKVGPSPEWVVKHLESIGQRSVNNIVDAANIVMFDCGQPCHAFDLDKIKDDIIIRSAKDGEEITTLDNKQIKLKSPNVVIADKKNILAIAGIKGGKIAEVDNNTKNIIIEVANFDPTSIRKTGKDIGIFTDALKRFENDLSPKLCDFAMLETSGLLAEYGFNDFEDIIDIYPQKQAERQLSFSAERISKILGLNVSIKEIEDILKRYNFEYKKNNGKFKIIVPFMRLDLIIEEDIAEEVGRILGYDKVKPKIPKINFKPKTDETHAKISWVRNKLLTDGYSEVMTYVFCEKGEMEVEKSASDKKFLRTNLTDGLKESLKLTQINASLLGLDEVKIFEIGTVFQKNGEEIHVAYNEKPARNASPASNASRSDSGWHSDAGGEKIKEMSLEDFCKSAEPDAFVQDLLLRNGDHSQKHSDSALISQKFKMWSLFPFIARDIAVWVPQELKSSKVKENIQQIINKNAGELLIRGPELFDEFKKGDKISYAFRLVFQSYNRTLTDTEVNEIMTKITNKIKENNDWQVR